MNFRRKYRSSLRGTFLIDNSGRFKESMPRKENLKFIASYLHAFPCAKVSDCKKALVLWRGYVGGDESRGIYASYFYDRYANKWWYNNRWKILKDKETGKKRMMLTADGLLLVDTKLSNELKTWVPKQRVQIVIKDDNPDEVEKMAGYKYTSLFPEKL